jgi:hypothetical protein
MRETPTFPIASALATWPYAPREACGSVAAGISTITAMATATVTRVIPNLEAVSLLTPEQYCVTQEDGTEPAFQNE